MSFGWILESSSLSSSISFSLSVVGLTWYCFIWIVVSIGCCRLYLQYGRGTKSETSLEEDEFRSSADSPYVTILRPITGIEPLLYQCLESCILQEYPRQRLSIRFCLPSRKDPAFPLVQSLEADARRRDPGLDLQVYLQDENLAEGEVKRIAALGPNRKIQNLSRGYKEAKGDLIWILDCNVWVQPETCSRMVEVLLGKDTDGIIATPAKLVHQMPVAVDVHQDTDSSTGSPISQKHGHGYNGGALLNRGGELEAMFLATSHAKFYTAINTVAIAPCLVGKSNMFRRSHLEALTRDDPDRPAGIDYFSWHICEDHMIGDLLWKQPVPPKLRNSGEVWKNHVLVPNYPAFQPLADMGVAQYLSRRTRWLTARKWTVVLATAVEPGTEAFICSLIGAWAFEQQSQSIVGTLSPARRLLVGASFWMVSVTLWAAVDWWVSGLLLQQARPPVRLQRVSRPRRPAAWLLTWVMREGLALPIWLQGVCLSNTVNWRGSKIRVGPDMRANPVCEEERDKID